MPKNWTRALWKSETDATFHKTRSALLTAVDNALHTYCTAVPMHKLAALHLLMDAYDAWANSKDAEASSVRNKRGATYQGGSLLTDFKAWMLEKQNDLMPVKEPNWNGIPNCYAYAMKCPVNAGQPPVPGVAAGHPVYVTAALNGISYQAALFQGIVADAHADNNKVVQILSQPNPLANTYPLPTQLPQFTHRADGGHYIAAMVVSNFGFHFLRRDSATGLWSHKNGAQLSPVETYAEKLAVGNLPAGTRHVPITDAVALDMLTCNSVNYVSFNTFRFAGYLLVPHGGVAVRG